MNLVGAVILATLWSVNGQQAPSPYYGLPLGSIFYSSTSTQGEVYVSEPRKIIIVNFQHGGELGCTSFMAGPPVQGTNISLAPSKDGIILAVQPKTLKRRRRQPKTSGQKSEKSPQDGIAVIKFGGSSSEEIPAPAKAANPAAKAPESGEVVRGTGSGGIKWQDQAKPDPTKTPVAPANSAPGGGIHWGDSKANPVPAPKPQATSNDVIQLGGGDGVKKPKAKIRDLPIEYIGGINIPDDEEGKNNPNITAYLNDPFSPDRPSIPINRRATDAPITTSESYTFHLGGKKIVTTASPTTEEPVKTFRGLPIAQEAPIVKSEKSTLGPFVPVTEQVDTGNRTECGNGWCVVPDPRQRSNVTRQNLADAPAPVPQAAQTSTQQPLNGTMSYFVVEDRRAQFLPPELIRREQAQRAASANGAESGERTGPVNLAVISQPKEEPAVPVPSVRYDPPVVPKDGKTYLLPKYNGETIIVEVPEPYEISEFQWFGIYDHCKRVRTASVNVRGVKAPKEVKLDGIRGWQYDVSSGDIYVKNCNTLMITNFTFNGAGKTEAYIYVGNGAFPHSIIQKARAYVDGTFPDRALKNFNNDNIVIKLPSGWRTFDITWIAVFNPKGNVSYGHVLVPQAVVPACDDPK